MSTRQTIATAYEYSPAQVMQTVSPATEYLQTVQLIQVLFEEAPLVAECVPAAKLVQTVATTAEMMMMIRAGCAGDAGAV
jgi:hypothetical protein